MATTDLPGMLPPDAGRFERAARRYAIAALSRHMANDWSRAGDTLARIRTASEAMRRVSGWIDKEGYTPLSGWAYWPPRLIRARVALYLRWCERVERMRDGDDEAHWGAVHRDRYGYPWPTVYLNENDMVRGFRWAVPLWTLAPAHDPAVTPKMRRRR